MQDFFANRPQFSQITAGVMIAVRSLYLPNQSQPQISRYVWAYKVTIANQRSDTVQLISRYWRITNGRGRIEEVEGEGVVGQQPILAPGQHYDYASGCPLDTNSGFMGGYYRMKTLEGSLFQVDIPTFSLDYPFETPVMN